MLSKMVENKTELMRHVGSLSQVAGLKRYQFLGGMASGVEGVDVRTGGGLSYTVLPGRGMDIAWADFRGSALSYISKTGVVSPQFYDPRGMEWLKGFFGGLLTTCGLSNVGGPCIEKDPVIGERSFGLHGRISNTIAENFSMDAGWTDDGAYRMSLRGLMRESIVHGENLVLRREISSELGVNAIILEDEVENCSLRETPLMILYHINLGYPLLDNDSVLESTARRVEPGNEAAAAEADSFGGFEQPLQGYSERLYYHDLCADGDGRAYVSLVNERLGYGMVVSFLKREFPQLTEWKMMNETEYVVGIEPGNTRPIGRAAARAGSQLALLAPGEKRHFALRFDILDGADEIMSFRRKVKSILANKASL